MARVLVMAALTMLGVASCTTTARISDLNMALDGEADRKRSIFFTDTKEIHCVVEMGIGRKGVTVEAIIRQLQSYDFGADKFFETNRVFANAESSPPPQEGIQKLDLILKPAGPNGEDATGSPFPPGRYQCEARLDGELEKTTIFNIDFPDCPTSEVRTGQLCFGFYKNGQGCGRYGLTSTDPAVCVCSAKTGWDCGK